MECESLNKSSECEQNSVDFFNNIHINLPSYQNSISFRVNIINFFCT